MGGYLYFSFLRFVFLCDLVDPFFDTSPFFLSFSDQYDGFLLRSEYVTCRLFRGTSTTVVRGKRQMLKCSLLYVTSEKDVGIWYIHGQFIRASPPSAPPPASHSARA